MKNILLNVVKSHRTSIPGIMLILFAGFCFWYSKVEVLGLLSMLLVGCLLLGANDKIIEKLTFGLLHIEDNSLNEENKS